MRSLASKLVALACVACAAASHHLQPPILVPRQTVSLRGRKRVSVTSSTPATASSSHSSSASSHRSSSASTNAASSALSYSTSPPQTTAAGGADNSLLDPNYDAFDDDDVFLTQTYLIPRISKTRKTPPSVTAISQTFAPPAVSSPTSTVVPATTTTSSQPSQAQSVTTSSSKPTPTTSSTSSAATSIKPSPTTTKPKTLTSSYLAFGTGTCPTIIGKIKAVQTSTTITWPAPTRSAIATCTSVPTNFAGTDAGFKQLCAGQRYCDPKAVDRVTFTSLTGEVTRTEIETMLGELQGTGAVLETGHDNALSVGWAGWGAYGAQMLFEFTGDRRALDVAVRMADNILAIRNNPKTGRIMWNGQRDLIWPTKEDASSARLYAGSENMHVVGHMVNAAIMILKNPCIWDMIPQWTSAPTNFSKTATYLDRAKAYVTAGDETVESYFLPWFFNPDGLMIQPNDTRWNTAKDFAAGTWMPWNRRALMFHGLAKLATVHTLDPVKDSVRAARYNGLLDANVRDFVYALNPTTSRGFNTYTWYYANTPPAGTVEMVRGLHGYYDIWGLYIAWQHGAAPETLTDTVMQTLANTMQHQIYSEDSSKVFAAYVNGYANLCNVREQPLLYVWGGWAMYGKWSNAWYTAVSTAGMPQIKSIWVTAPILWTKAAIARNSDAFWRGSGYA